MRRMVSILVAIGLALLLLLLFTCTVHTNRAGRAAASPTPAAYLPIATRGYPSPPATERLLPAYFQYEGAFRLADGTPCPPADLTGCAGHNWARGWWSSRFDAQFILYDPADLADVAAGRVEPWEPQPYAALDIDEHLFLNPAGIGPEMLGTGPQRRFRIGDVAYDRAHGLLYVLELFADEAKPVVHVWRVE